MVSERAKEANYFGKYDTPYKRKDVPQNATGKNAVKTKANKPESRGAKPQNAPAKKQKLPDKAPVPTPRPDLTPQPTTFEPGGSMVPPIFEPGGSTMPPPFAPGGSQLAMPAGTPFPPGPSTAPILPMLQNLPSTGMTQMRMPATGNTMPSPMPMPTDPRLNMQAPDPRIQALNQRLQPRLRQEDFLMPDMGGGAAPQGNGPALQPGDFDIRRWLG